MRVSEHEDHLAVRFDNGVSVDVLRSDGVFDGLGVVRAGRRKLRSDELPILPLIRTPDGQEAARLELRHVEPVDGGLRLTMLPFMQRSGMAEWRGDDGRQRWDVADWGGEPVCDRGGLLELTLRPVSRQLGGVAFEGFSYAWHYRSRKYPIWRIHDRGTWELGGYAAGNRFWMRGPFNPPRVTLRKAERYTTAGWSRPDADAPSVRQFQPLMTSLQGFAFQFDAQGLLVTVPEALCHCRSMFQKAAGANYFVHWHQLCADLSGSVAFPAMQVLYAGDTAADESARVDQYCGVRHDLETTFRTECGQAMPRGAISGVLHSDAATRVREFERGLDALVHAGCRHVLMPDILAGAAPRDPTPERAATALRRVRGVIDRAHRRSVRVGIPLHETCRPWVMQGCATDDPPETRPGDLPVQALLHRDAADLMLTHMQSLRSVLAPDILYCRQACLGAIHELNTDWPGPPRPTRGRGQGSQDPRFAETGGLVRSLQGTHLSMQSALHRIGYTCLPVGLVGMGGTLPDSACAHVEGAEFMYRDALPSFPLRNLTAAGIDPFQAWFRACAWRAGYVVPCQANQSVRGGLPTWWRKPYAAVNLAFQSVHDYMLSSHALPRGRGVIWSDGDGEVSVLWTFAEMRWKVQRSDVVFDVLGSRALRPEKRTLNLPPWRIYMVQTEGT